MPQNNDIIVTALRGNKKRGVLRYGVFRTACALGRGGVTAKKQEGDTKTPLGRYPLRRLWYRADRMGAPDCGLPMHEIRPKSGWCDDARTAFYNRPILRPHRFSHERLWRQDRLYDVIVELGYNDAPPVPGQGSAIFLHLEKNNYRPTLGCVAISRQAMTFLLPRLEYGGFIDIRDSL